MKSRFDLEERRNIFNECMSAYKARIIICAGTGCVANGSLDVYEKFKKVIRDRGLTVAVSAKKEKADYIVSQSGCQGFCQRGPLVTLYPQGVFYTKVKQDDVDEIIDKTLLRGELIERLLYHSSVDGSYAANTMQIPFYEKQQRMVLKLCGYIDAQDIDEYIANGGYKMAEKAVHEMSSEEICGIMLKAGLRGRGGAGFPTGRKWDLARIQSNEVKYIICNGDEGDPGAFMNRCVMEGNPHSIIEGMIVAAKAIGAKEGYIYVRTEYPLAVERLKIAIRDAVDAGILGKNILGSEMELNIQVMEGAGAFVCGEETALMASIEGKRGMPTPKPPFPAEKGLFGKPTVINNVETLASVPIIMQMGPEVYASFGTEKSKGTKTFALTGHVANTGLIEVPFGVTLRNIINDIGGGVVNDDGTVCGVDFKVVQIGGPSGGCLTKEHLDMPLDYENLTGVGAMVGSGGLVVMNDQTCIVQIARFFMQFTQNESCGKCVPCREGTKQLLSLLDDIIEGRATGKTLELLERLAQTVKVCSLCALGKTAPNPVLSTLKYFREEYNAHVFEKRCPTLRCTTLREYKIDPLKCKGCGICSKKCPAGAISGTKGQPYQVNKDTCIKCGICSNNCKFGAVTLN
jgi:NADH-quinone oxidoreductase subunit F